MNSKELIGNLIDDTKAIMETVEHKFKPLNQVDLNFKTNGWSINECIEHLNTADDHYIDLFEQRLVSGVKIDSEYEFKPGMLGNYFTKSMKPKADGTIPSKMKTLSKFQPKPERISTCIDVFLKDQIKMLDILEKSRTADLNKLKVHSAIGKIINFKMGDALRFVVAHNQRHILQAENVMRAMEQSVVLN
jgi:hypothetical protein